MTQSISATALQWQIHVRGIHAKSKCDLSCKTKQLSESERGGAGQRKERDPRSSLFQTRTSHVTRPASADPSGDQRGEDSRTRKAVTATKKLPAMQMGDLERQKSKKKERPENKESDAVPPAGRDHRRWVILRTVPGAHYSCSGLMADSPKSSEGSARLYSRGWAKGDANAGRRRFKD